MYEGETITFFGETDGSATGGTLNLDSDVLYTSVDYVRPDKGCKSKIWIAKLTGKPATIFLEQTEDVTASSPTWKRITSYHLASEGELHEDERRPVVLLSRDGKQAWRFTWLQEAPGKTYATIKVEFSWEK